MLDAIKGFFSDFFKSRLLILGIVFAVLSFVLLQRLFQLQIVEGENYENSFNVRIKRERVIPCTRGLIYDCNGELLAYNKLVYSVVIGDEGNYADLKEKNATLNPALMKLFEIIESRGDKLVNDFGIVLNQSNEYEFTVEGKARDRFLSGVYGVAVKDLEEEQKNASAEDVMKYLCNKEHYDLSEKEYSRSDILKIVTVRFGLTQNNYQKYITTTVATDVSAETVAIVLENQDDIPGVSIQEDTIRQYHEDSKYASHILGYTGMISEEELDSLKNIDEKYDENYVVGKAGVEESMESTLQGTQGSETFYVDYLGKVIEVEDRVEPKSGNDVYLTIDINLQKTIYEMLEQHIAGLVSSKIVSTSAYETRKIDDSDDVAISIDDVYFALINNNVIDVERFSQENASETEKQVYQLFQNKKQAVTGQIMEQLNNAAAAPEEELSEEMQGYMTYMEDRLLRDGILMQSAIDSSDETYLAWNDGKISLREYLYHCIAQNWVDVTRVSSDSDYADADEIYQFMLRHLQDIFETDAEFHKKIYEYMILDKELTGQLVCLILYEQGVLEKDDTYNQLHEGSLDAMSFIIGKINSLAITPAQLALDPCSASAVVTDVNTGQIRALVTYPSYDNTKLANRIDGEYYNKLLNDKSLPLFNRATQQKTAPGSTLKMLTSVAGLEEGVITTSETINDEGRFTKVSNMPRCWYYPHSHGQLRVAQALEHSCNYFFYEVGYRLSTDENGEYDENLGIEKLTKYAQIFGLGEKSGVEIEETVPQISKKYPVMAAIGQAEHNFATIHLAKYVTAVANGGTVYDLTLIDKVMNSKGDLLEKREPKIYQKTNFSQDTWSAVHEGMRAMAISTSTLSNLGVAVAGKTGTAQEDDSRPNHALFVGYAPYDNPEISIAIKVAYGYNSSNATAIARDIWNYYFRLRSYEQLVTHTAIAPGSQVIHD